MQQFDIFTLKEQQNMIFLAGRHVSTSLLTGLGQTKVKHAQVSDAWLMWPFAPTGSLNLPQLAVTNLTERLKWNQKITFKSFKS